MSEQKYRTPVGHAFTAEEFERARESIGFLSDPLPHRLVATIDAANKLVKKGWEAHDREFHRRIKHEKRADEERKRADNAEYIAAENSEKAYVRIYEEREARVKAEEKLTESKDLVEDALEEMKELQGHLHHAEAIGDFSSELRDRRALHDAAVAYKNKAEQAEADCAALRELFAKLRMVVTQVLCGNVSHGVMVSEVTAIDKALADHPGAALLERVGRLENLEAIVRRLRAEKGAGDYQTDKDDIDKALAELDSESQTICKTKAPPESWPIEEEEDDTSNPCPLCHGRAVLVEATEAWDIPGAEPPACDFCWGTGSWAGAVRKMESLRTVLEAAEECCESVDVDRKEGAFLLQYGPFAKLQGALTDHQGGR